jgi:hypothetical protein
MALYPGCPRQKPLQPDSPRRLRLWRLLTSVPQDFSIGISYTTSNASLAVPTDAVSTLDIDASGDVWFPSNGPGQTGLVEFFPAGSTGFYGPYNGTAMVNPTQVAIDNAGSRGSTIPARPSSPPIPSATPASPTSYTFAISRNHDHSRHHQ